jgi:DNA-binding winged helix-turn-helix (wHTH) protein
MEGRQVSFSPFVLSPGKELRRDGKVVPLGQRGLVLLEAMLAAEGQVLTKAEILEKVWPGLNVEEGNITVHVAVLRKELGTRPTGEDWLVTVPRIGYRLPRRDSIHPGSSPSRYPDEDRRPIVRCRRQGLAAAAICRRMTIRTTLYTSALAWPDRFWSKNDTALARFRQLFLLWHELGFEDVAVERFHHIVRRTCLHCHRNLPDVVFGNAEDDPRAVPADVGPNEL